MKPYSKKIKKYLLINTFFIGLSLVILSGCKKLVQVDPPINEVVGDDIYSTNIQAASVLTGIYTTMSNSGIFNGQLSISLRTGLSSDELVTNADPSNILYALYTNTLTNNGDQLYWTDLYTYVFKANSAIEGLTKSSGVTAPVKQQLLSEAKFIRAFMYFYLVNLYGDVPLLTSTDIKINSTAGRTAKDKVYQQIIVDLQEAIAGLNNNYTGSDAMSTVTDRVRPNKATAMALLARVYLYTNQWAQAEQESTQIIENNATYQLENLNNVFLFASKEAIWQLQPVNVGQNTLDASVFVLAAGTLSPIPGPNGDSRPVYLSKQIFDAFEMGDQRKTNWIDSVTVNGVTYPYAYKYKAWDLDQPRTENLMVFRLGEQYLIRAEARAQLGKVLGSGSAESDLDAIRLRAGLKVTNASDKSTMLAAIYKERKVELFTEWGHRWLDLKRTNTIDLVMGTVAPLKNASWATYKALYPIPVDDIKRDVSLQGHQNPGYPEN